MANVDIEIFRGANGPPVTWPFVLSIDPQVIFDFTGATARLSVYRGETLLFRIDADRDPLTIGIDIPSGKVTWMPSLAQSRLVPEGRLCRYELEYRLGGIERSFAYGYVTGRGGLNDD